MRPLQPGSFRTVPGLYYGTPKEVWGFRSARGSGTPLAIAREFLSANEDLLGLRRIRGQLRKPLVKRSLGADHVIIQQHHRKVRVHRAYVTVHIGRRDRRVYLVKSRAMPWEFLPGPVRARRTRDQAIRKAHRFLGVSRADSKVLEVEKIWFPWEDELRLSRKVRLEVMPPREQRQEWILYLDAVTGEVLSYYDNLASAKARVFDPNPVIALGGDAQLLVAGKRVRVVPAAAYTDVALRDLDGRGFLDGRYVTTKPTPNRVESASGDFVFTSRQRGFEEAMAYFHIDRAVRYFESLGFEGERAIFGGPVAVSARANRRDQSVYSPGRKELAFGLGGGVNDAEDAETILHELGHAVQDAICPDFGQSTQAAAMGEGFGDYLALSFFAKRPARYADCVMVWDGIHWNENDPPCVRKHGHGISMESFDADAGEHENGRIWAETLLDINRSLGRRKADTLILESHFQLDGFTTFARGARALLDADRNLFPNGNGVAGRHTARLRRIFRFRGIGPI